MKKLLLLLLCALCVTAHATTDARNGATTPSQGTMVGGIGADGKFHFLLTGNDGGLSISTTGLATSANQSTQITAEQAILATLGATSGAAVVTDANGTAQQYLRGLIKLWIAGLAAGEAHIGEVGGKTVIVGGSFTRPSDTTAYASGDLVANSVTAGSVTPITVSAARVNDGTGMIRRVRLTTSSTSTTNASFRVHFYKSSPTCTNGDNGAWLTTESTYLGSCDVTVDKAFSDGAKGIGAPNTGSEINFIANTGTTNIFALIEARAAYTPTSGETITLAAEVLQN